MSVLILDKARAPRVACRSFVGNHNEQLRYTLRKAMMFPIVGAAAVLAPACGGGPQQVQSSTPDPAVIAQGKQTFRFDTFGDETLWTDRLRMHEVIRSAVDPTTALSIGLKPLPKGQLSGMQPER